MKMPPVPSPKPYQPPTLHDRLVEGIIDAIQYRLPLPKEWVEMYNELMKEEK